jgi:hypothetical protein
LPTCASDIHWYRDRDNNNNNNNDTATLSIMQYNITDEVDPEIHSLSKTPPPGITTQASDAINVARLLITHLPWETYTQPDTRVTTTDIPTESDSNTTTHVQTCLSSFLDSAHPASTQFELAHNYVKKRGAKRKYGAFATLKQLLATDGQLYEKGGGTRAGAVGDGEEEEEMGDGDGDRDAGGGDEKETVAVSHPVSNPPRRSVFDFPSPSRYVRVPPSPSSSTGTDTDTDSLAASPVHRARRVRLAGPSQPWIQPGRSLEYTGIYCSDTESDTGTDTDSEYNTTTTTTTTIPIPATTATTTTTTTTATLKVPTSGPYEESSSSSSDESGSSSDSAHSYDSNCSTCVAKNQEAEKQTATATATATVTPATAVHIQTDSTATATVTPATAVHIQTDSTATATVTPATAVHIQTDSTATTSNTPGGTTATITCIDLDDDDE